MNSDVNILFIGAACDVNINDCSNSPCENDGQCEDGVDGYRCACEPGFTGKRCQHTVDDCASEPCQNGATCKDLLDGFQCICRPGFVGKPLVNYTDFNILIF